MKSNSQERWILYSTCDEDSYSEIKALDLKSDDTVLCVTGSGCRTLSLLSGNPKRLISIDYSPGQNYLLELKLAAIRNLSYESLLQFLGVEESSERYSIFTSLEDKLSAKTVAYFRNNKSAIQQGILFAGRHEQFYIRFVVPGLQLLFGRSFDKLFAAKTLEEQRQIYQNEIDGWLWRSLIRFGFSTLILKVVLNDPNYDIEITRDSVSQYLIERLDHTFNHHLARENHWVSLMFKGKYLGRRCLPHFLLEENYRAIRQATTEVEIITSNILDYLQSCPNKSINKYSLSDVSSCMKEEPFNTLLREVARTSASQGRLCYRNFLTHHFIPTDLLGMMARDDDTSAQLNWDDLAFAYTFEVATIQ